MPAEKEEAITFEYIRKIQRKEKYEAKLTQIPDDFYKKAREYLERKMKLAKKKGDNSTQRELSNVQGVLQDIYNRRETKILEKAVFSVRTGVPPQNLSKIEKKFFDQLTELLKYQRENTLNMLTKKSKGSKEKVKFKKVKFTQDIPEFVGSDMRKYGPFEPEQEAKIPSENAKLMIKSGNAEKVK
ncbi:MAG: hypothetical protein GF368_04270 [Candidatus Aenigmarchaeota archaeon]|nr:hypothetical protein [Candidatus Aenigmarchaeota archaeon]